MNEKEEKETKYRKKIRREEKGKKGIERRGGYKRKIK